MSVFWDFVKVKYRNSSELLSPFPSSFGKDVLHTQKFVVLTCNGQQWQGSVLSETAACCHICILNSNSRSLMHSVIQPFLAPWSVEAFIPEKLWTAPENSIAMTNICWTNVVLFRGLRTVQGVHFNTLKKFNALWKLHFLFLLSNDEPSYKVNRYVNRPVIFCFTSSLHKLHKFVTVHKKSLLKSEILQYEFKISLNTTDIAA